MVLLEQAHVLCGQRFYPSLRETHFIKLDRRDSAVFRFTEELNELVHEDFGQSNSKKRTIEPVFGTLEANPNGVDTETVRVLTCQLARCLVAAGGIDSPTGRAH